MRSARPGSEREKLTRRARHAAPKPRAGRSSPPRFLPLGSAAEIRRRVVTTSGGQSLAYAEAGSGPDLVLIHGMLTTLEDMWLGPMSALASRFRCVAFDRPGQGQSSRRRLEDASIWRQAEALGEAFRALGLWRPILVGHSLGGAVAMACAMTRPEEVGGVLGLAPLCFPELRLEHFFFGPRALPWVGDGWARAMHDTADPLLLPVLWRSMFLPQEMPQRFAEEFPFQLAGESVHTVAEGESAAYIWPDLTRSVMGYKDCHVPVIFLCGDADAVVNNAIHGYAAAQLLPWAKFRWLHGCGHMLHHFRQDEVLAAAEELAELAHPQP